MKNIIITSFIVLLISCNKSGTKSTAPNIKNDYNVESQSQNVLPDTSTIEKTHIPELSQMDKLNSVLRQKGHYLIGSDSVKRHSTVNDCIVLNGMKRVIFVTKEEKTIFNSPTACDEYFYKREEKGKTINSMRIIKLSFDSDADVINWEKVYLNSPQKDVVEAKPRTAIYRASYNNIYVVQTYYDGGTRKMLNDVLEVLKQQ